MLSFQSVQPRRLSLHGPAESSVCLKETDSPLVYLMIVCGPLDREEHTSLQINLMLRNSQNEVLFDHPVYMNLIDVNDNTPQWNQTEFHLQWKWHRMGRSAVGGGADPQFRLLAWDPDEGDNGRVRYSVVNVDNSTAATQFGIDPELGVLQFRPHFHPGEDSTTCSTQPSTIHFQVLAEDNGKPTRRQSKVDVWVEMVDADAPAPRFEKTLYEVKVREDVDAGTCLLRVGSLQRDYGSKQRVYKK